MLPHPLTNFKKQKYQNEPKLNRVYSRNNLPKKKHEVYVINLDEYESTGTHWIASQVNGNSVAFFDSFGTEYIPKEIKKFTDGKKRWNAWNAFKTARIYV